MEVNSVEDLDGMIVTAEIVDFGDADERPVGRIIEILGRPDDFGIDVEILIRAHHIPHHFPDDVLEQARAIPGAISDDEIARRRDFRALDIVTIDGETARDFDDAVWVERLPNGHFALQVHIADVSHYVRPARPSIARPCCAAPASIFRIAPCPCCRWSFRPINARCVRTRIGWCCRRCWKSTDRATWLRRSSCRGVIRSAERMTYTAVHGVLEGDAALRERYAALDRPLRADARAGADSEPQAASRRGSIDFDLPEPLLEFDEFGEMTGVTRAPRNIAHRLIEEFMLAANEAVASHLEAAGVPMIFRIHERPDPQARDGIRRDRDAFRLFAERRARLR